MSVSETGAGPLLWMELASAAKLQNILLYGIHFLLSEVRGCFFPILVYFVDSDTAKTLCKNPKFLFISGPFCWSENCNLLKVVH